MVCVREEVCSGGCVHKTSSRGIVVKVVLTLQDTEIAVMRSLVKGPKQADVLPGYCESWQLVGVNLYRQHRGRGVCYCVHSLREIPEGTILKAVYRTWQ